MHPLMTQTITHYPVVSEHNFVLSVIPVFIMKKEKKSIKSASLVWITWKEGRWNLIIDFKKG